MRKVAVFADVSNLFYGIRKKFPNRKLNYKLYLTKLCQDFQLFRAFAYGSTISGDEFPFIYNLKYCGFETRFRKAKIFDGKIERVNWNLVMALEVARVIDKVDIIILGSSDPEIVPLIQWIKEKGIQVYIYTANAGKKMRRVCDKFLSIEEDLLEISKN